VTDLLAPQEPSTLPLDGGILGSEESLRDIAAAVGRRRWVVALVFLATVAIGTWRTMTEPRIYASAVTVRVERSDNPLANAPSNGPQYDFRVDPLVSEQQVIRSQTIAERTALAAGLQLAVTRPVLLLSSLTGSSLPVVRPEAVPGTYTLSFGDSTFSLSHGSSRWGPAHYGTTLDAGAFTLTIPHRPALSDRTVELTVSSLDGVARDLRSRISTRVLPQTDIVEITIDGPDPLRVQHAANSIASVYADYAREAAQARAQKRSQFIAQSLDEQAASLKRSQDSLRDFQELHRTSNVTDEQTELFKQIYKLQADRSELLLEQQVYLALVGRLAQTDTTDDELRKLVGTDAVEHNKSVADLYGSWFQLETTRQRLSLSRDDRNIDLQALDSSIASTKRNLQLASRLYLQSLATRIESIDSSVADLRRSSEQFPPMAAEQARLTANVKTRETGYDNLLAQYQLARISEGGETGGVRIIDPAPVPYTPVSPQRKRAVLLAAIIGLLLGLLSAVVADRFDDSVQTPDEVRHRLHLPILGSIPRVRDTLFGRSERQRFRLISHVEPQSLIAEAFRSLRTNIAFARAHHDLRTIVLTSPGPGDGKSTVACNLATIFAQQGQRTLLIDADLRRAVVNETFDVPRSPGLSDLLVGNARLAQVVKAVDVPNLFLLPSGQFPPNPSELLGSPAMRDVLEEANAGYDMIVIDSPPVLAVTDSSVISSVVDGTIVVVRVGKTARDAVRRGVAQLRVVNGRVLGAVLNDVDFRSGVYYGGYGYYYQRFYGDGDESASDMQGNPLRRWGRALGGRLPGRGR
jgi:capsular exopolysaccharide synthesis family protein